MNMPLLPYSTMMTNFFIWLVYGTMVGDSTVLFTNLVCWALGVIYCVCYLVCVPRGATYLPGRAEYHVGGSAIIIALTLQIYWNSPPGNGVKLLGWMGTIMSVCMSLAPLATIVTVLKEKSTRTMALPLTVGQFINSSLWSIYGLCVGNDFIIGPSIAGVVTAVMQLLLFGLYGANREGPGAVESSSRTKVTRGV
eukprot:FR736623.1.p1 GENE.FR736623.1~~FR736623.1.p1  ORF type:complete len:195 (+),score=6.00 FR736623.1:238-822(+)